MWKLMRVTLVLLICVKDSLSQLNVCGHARLNPRIVGGKGASEGEWPWMVSLYNTAHFCGGSLINKEWVLTAAHCVVGKDMATLHLYLGKTTQQGPNSNEITRTVKKSITHSSYDGVTCDNDIALLQLSSAVTFNDYIRPVCLAAQNSNFPAGTKGWITGWGATGVRTVVSNTHTVPVALSPPGNLQEVEVQVYGNDDCRILCCGGPITKNMICAGTPQGGRGFYKGDSGGPMVNKHCSVWVQSGVISWFEGCAQPNKPDGYARVSEYQQWITSIVGQNLPGFVVFNPQTPCLPANQLG